MSDLRRVATPIGSGARFTRKDNSSRVKSLMVEEKENHASPSLRTPKSVRKPAAAGTAAAGGSQSASTVRHKVCTSVQRHCRLTPDLRTRKRHAPPPIRSTPIATATSSATSCATATADCGDGGGGSVELHLEPPQTVAVSVYVRVRPLNQRTAGLSTTNGNCDETAAVSAAGVGKGAAAGGGGGAAAAGGAGGAGAAAGGGGAAAGGAFQSDCCVTGDSKSVVIASDPLTSHTFCYDRVLWSDTSCRQQLSPAAAAAASQAEVYDIVAAPLLDSTLKGFNVCLLAYGQTGSGKTHSMMGRGSGEMAGVIPRFCRHLFARIGGDTSGDTDTSVSLTVQLSYYEIYNERIRDLLTDDEECLRVREHPVLGPHVAGLSCPLVDSWPTVMELIEAGNRRRATASTAMNNKSSRSHSVLTLTFVRAQSECVYGETVKSQQTSVANLVDLAGSERVTQTQATGLRHKEGVSINMSLLTLGKVITALTDGGTVHVPYRESNLTWLLKESLGGNSRTAMLATISSSERHVDESLATLRYACLAKQVVNSVRANEDPYARVISQLRQEVERLRQEQLKLNTQPASEAAAAVDNNQQQQQLQLSTPPLTSAATVTAAAAADSPRAAQCRRTIAQLCRKLQQRDTVLLARDQELREAKQRLAAGGAGARPGAGAVAAVAFPCAGVCVPCLVLLLPDPALSETAAYPLAVADGVNSVGTGVTDNVRVHALTVSAKHCVLECHKGRVQLTHVAPSAGDTTTLNTTSTPSTSTSSTATGAGVGTVFVNGAPLTAASCPRQLQHGDRLVLAAEVFLRVHLPARGVLGLAGFEEAQQELQRASRQRAMEEQCRLKERVKSELMREMREQQLVDGQLALHADKLQLESQISTLTNTLHELQKQKLALEARPVVSSRLATDTVSHSPRLSPSQSDFLQRLEDVFDLSVSECHVTEGGGGAAAAADDVIGGGLADGVCGAASVMDGSGGGELRCTDTQQQQLGCRSYSQLVAQCHLQSPLTASGITASSSSAVGASAVCQSAARLVASYEWRAGGDHCHSVSQLLTGAGRLTSCLTAIQQQQQLQLLQQSPAAVAAFDKTECVEQMVAHFHSLLTAYLVWRQCGHWPDQDQCLSHLEHTVRTVQSSLAHVLKCLSVADWCQVKTGVDQCCHLVATMCCLLGAVQHEPIAPQVEAGGGAGCAMLGHFVQGVRMSLDHALLEAVTVCQDSEAQLSAFADDSVNEQNVASGCGGTAAAVGGAAAAGGGGGCIFSGGLELVACVRCFLDHIRSLQRNHCAALSETPGTADNAAGVETDSVCDSADHLAVLRHLSLAVGDTDRLRLCVEALSNHLSSHHRGESLSVLDVRQTLGHVFAALVQLTAASQVTCSANRVAEVTTSSASTNGGGSSNNDNTSQSDSAASNQQQQQQQQRRRRRRSQRDVILRRHFADCVTACRSLMTSLTALQPAAAAADGSCSSSWYELLESTAGDDSGAASLLETGGAAGQSSCSQLLLLSVSSGAGECQQMSLLSSRHQLARRLQHAVQLLSSAPARSSLRDPTSATSGQQLQLPAAVMKRVHFEQSMDS